MRCNVLTLFKEHAMESRTMNPGMGATAAGAATRAHDALDTAVDKVSPAVNRMVDKAHETIDRLAQTAGPAAESMQSAVRQAGDTSVRLAEAAANSIRAKPLAYVASAIAVGYVIGRLMR
jgi:ElaB/YqjD/DUF883 family membrane-anchored ribosome-binding protein